jgi:glycosyltransferase involved in cell wall biosynthesis
MLPLVSIVIPVYNGANYMREAIDSALAQTYQNTEVLVVNDGSTDGGRTEEIARSYGTRIRYFSKPNGRVGSALNLGLREMNGDYFAWLSHDDIFLPEKIARQIDFLHKNGAFAACYTDYFWIDAKGAILRKIRRPWLPRKKGLKRLFGYCYINGSTMVIRRKCFDQVGMFDEKLKYTQDMEMWFRLLQRFEIGRVAEMLGKMRLHSEQVSREELPIQRETGEILNYFFNDLSVMGLLDAKKSAILGVKTLAHRLIWYGLTLSYYHGWYDLGSEKIKKALEAWPSWRNPARFFLLVNGLISPYHRWQQRRVRGVHWLTTRIRSLIGRK